MIYCKVGKCPVDENIPLCCVYCSKNAQCPNACKRKNSGCSLAREVKEIKKRATKVAKIKIRYVHSNTE